MPRQAEQVVLGTDDDGWTYVVERLAKAYEVHAHRSGAPLGIWTDGRLVALAPAQRGRRARRVCALTKSKHHGHGGDRDLVCTCPVLKATGTVYWHRVLAFAFCNFHRRTWEELRTSHVDHLDGPTVVTTATLQWVTPAENRKRQAARLAEAAAARKSKRPRP